MIPFRTRVLVLIVFLAVGISGAAATGITLNAAQSDFPVLTGNEAVITLVSENTYDHDVPGNLIVSTSTLPNPPVPSGLPVNDSRTKTYTMFRGVSNITLSSGVSDVPSVRLIQVMFTCNEGSNSKVTLGPITVRYLPNPPLTQAGGPQLKSSTEQETGSSQPGGSSGNGPVNGAAGQPSSGTGGSGNRVPETTGAGPSGSAPAAYQAPAESGALKSLVKAENEKVAQIENDLTEKIAADPRVKAIDANLTTHGFGNYDKAFTPVNQSSGRAIWSYRADGSRSATLSAVITENVVRDVTVSSSDPSVLPKNLTEDPEIRQSLSSLENKGYTPEKYEVTMEPGGRQSVEVIYRDNGSRTATLSASIVNGTIVNTTAGEDFNPRMLLFPFILALLPAGIAVSHFYYQKQKKNAAVIPPGDVSSGGFPEYYATVNNLLDSAESAYKEGRYPDACGLAGRALRIFISGHYADGVELTDEEIMSLVRGQNPDTVLPAGEILSLCSLVRFGRGTPSGDEFSSVIRRIRCLLK